MPSSTPRISMASQDVGQRKLLDDEAAASRDIKQARIGQTVERESDRRAREPLGELLKGSSEIRSPGSISPDEHLSQVQQGATGLRSDFGAGPPVRPIGDTHDERLPDRNRSSPGGCANSSSYRYRQISPAPGLVTFEQFELPSTAVDS